MGGSARTPFSPTFSRALFPSPEGNMTKIRLSTFARLPLLVLTNRAKVHRSKEQSCKGARAFIGIAPVLRVIFWTHFQKQSCKSVEKARHYGLFDKKELHRNPDTHCIIIAVQLWLCTLTLIQSRSGCILVQAGAFWCILC